MIAPMTPPKIDYSRCPMWWWRVTPVGRGDCFRVVRAADYESACQKAAVIARDLWHTPWAIRPVSSVVVVPQMERSGPRRQAFAGYGDE